jgi:hypothetical protein
VVWRIVWWERVLEQKKTAEVCTYEKEVVRDGRKEYVTRSERHPLAGALQADFAAELYFGGGRTL